MSQFGVALRKILPDAHAHMPRGASECLRRRRWGGSSNSFGNTIPPNSGPGDAENFFPNATGNLWYYDTTTTAPSGTKAPRWT